jgi:hypothetical protein
MLSKINRLKALFLLLAFSLIGGGIYFFYGTHDTSAIVIESTESKTKDLTSVFNQIKWISTPTKDIWMMNQSHLGRNAKNKQWERLAIVIDKTSPIKTARYYQFEAGPLEWSDDLINKRTSYRASCFTCHSNGPRAIRPLLGSALAKLSLMEKIKINLWNIKIKTYGRIHYEKSHDVEDKTLHTPFHYSEKDLNRELKVATCVKCHKEEGLFSRGRLVFQQAGTIEAQVANGFMPPPGFSLSKKEKQQLKDFLRGF